MNYQMREMRSPVQHNPIPPISWSQHQAFCRMANCFTSNSNGCYKIFIFKYQTAAQFLCHGSFNSDRICQNGGLSTGRGILFCTDSDLSFAIFEFTPIFCIFWTHFFIPMWSEENNGKGRKIAALHVFQAIYENFTVDSHRIDCHRALCLSRCYFFDVYSYG